MHIFERSCPAQDQKRSMCLSEVLRVLSRPSALLVGALLSLIIVGTLLLRVVSGSGPPMRWIDALFTATSAACVAGLSVHAELDGPGKLVLGLLVQLGAIVVIVFGTWMIRPPVGGGSIRGFLRVVGAVAGVTLAIEGVGAVFLYGLWDDQVDGLVRRFGLSFFYAMSAFCHGGFDLAPEGLTAHRYAMRIHSVVLPLIFLGGLGFPVLLDLYQSCRDRWFTGSQGRCPSTLNSHSQLVLVMTAILYIVGLVVIGAGQLMPYLYEWLHQGVTAHAAHPDSLKLETAARILVDASFLSFSSRTAGLTLMPMDELEAAGRWGVMGLMLVGGSIGSPAGGMTSTVVAVLVVAVLYSVFKPRGVARSSMLVSSTAVRQAAVVFTCFGGLIFISTLFLCLSEPFRIEQLLFEVISAATTCGLSLGVTSDLTVFGKVVIIATMFVGRISPLLLWVAVIRTRNGYIG